MATKKKTSLKTMSYALITLITVLPMLISLLLVAPRTHDLLLDDAMLSQALLSEQTENRLDGETRRLITLLENKTDPIAYMLREDRLEKPLVNELFQAVLSREKAILALGLITPEGQVIVDGCRSTYHENKWPEHGPNYRQEIAAALDGQVHVGTPQVHQGKTIFHIAVPLGPLAQPPALLLAYLDAQPIWRKAYPDQARYELIPYLVSDAGTLLSRIPGSKWSPGDSLAHLDIVRTHQDHQDWDQSRPFMGARGTRSFGTIMHVDVLGWNTVTEMPSAAVVAPIRNVMAGLAVVAAVMALLFCAIGISIVRRITAPIGKLAIACDRVAKGDYARTIPTSSLQELDTLGAGFRHMTAEVDQRETALRESRAQVELLLNSTAEAIYGLDLQGNCTFANPACVQILGYADASELLGKNMHDLIHHTRSDGAAYPVEQCKIYQAFKEGQETHVDDEVFWRADGTHFPAEYWSHPIRRNGGIVGSVVTFLDITERKRTEEALQARVRQQAVVAKLGQYALGGEAPTRLMDLVVDHLAATLDVEYCKVLELLPDEKEMLLRTGVGWKDGLVGHAKVAAGQDSQAGFTLSSQTPVIVADLRTETRFSCPSLLRDHHVVSGMSVIIGDREAPWGVLSVHTTRHRIFNQEDANFLEAVANLLADAIARKRAENKIRKLNAGLEQRVAERTAELRETNQELESFTYSVSHDLRAPVRHILGYSGILVQDHAPALNDEARHHLQTIQGSAQKMGNLIDDLLTLSRLGRKPVRRQTVDCNRIVREAWDEVASRKEGTAAQLRIDSLPEIQADSALLRQVWINLLDNAAKYSSPRQTPEIIVDTHDQDGTTWYRIRDNGVGFDPQYTDKLFEVFQRLHDADEFPGTGIGLAIVQRIIHKHGGQVSGIGQVDKGACFEFSIGALDHE